MSHTTNVISIGNLNVETGSGYVATLTQSFMQPESTVSRVARDTDAPIVTNVALGMHVYYLQVLVEPAAADDVDARRRALLREFDSTRGPVTVVIENATGTARTRYMQFVVRKTDQAENQNGAGFVAALEAYDDVRWRSVDEEEAVWSLDGSEAKSLTVAGDLDVLPIYTVTPNAGKTTPNWPYSRSVLIEWQSPHGGKHPVDITGGGLDTEALLDDEKIADQSNIAVMMNGVLVKHWYQDDGYASSFGTDATQIWIDMTFKPQTIHYLAGYISDAATTIRLDYDDGLPPSGTLRIGSEYLSYTSRSSGYLYGVQRGLYGSTATGHNEAELVYWIQGVGQILYGPAAVTPDGMKDATYRAAARPIVVTPGSSNSVWRYLDFAAPGRSGSWTYQFYLNSLGFVNESDTYGSYATGWPTTWAALGLKAGWTSASYFRLRTAIPIQQTRVLGFHMIRYSPSGSPAAPKLDAWSEDGQSHVDIWNSSAGAVLGDNTWVDVWSDDIRPFDYRGYNVLRFVVSQSSFVQADIHTLNIVFDSGVLPLVTIGAEQTDYDLDLTIANTTTGESITVQYPNLAAGESLVIDSALQTVTYTLDGSSQYAAVRRDAARPRFLRLVPGVNNFQITEAGMGELEVKVQYRPRWYA